MLYKRYIKNHFFNKIFLIYILITLLSSSILFVTLSRNLSSIKREEALTMSDQILSTVDTFLEDKLDNALTFHQRLINNKTVWKMITDRMKKEDQTEYYMEDFQNDRDNIMQNVYAIDGEIYGVLFLGNEADILLRFGNMDEIGNSVFLEEAVRDMASMDKTRIYMVPDRKNTNKSNAFPFYLFSVVNDPDNFTRQIGIMGLCFSARNIPHVYQKFDPYRKGEIYILDENGNLLFDSAEKYEEDLELPFEGIQAAPGQEILKGDYLYNSVYSSRGAFYVVNAIPMDRIRADVKVLQINILQVMLLVLAAAFLLNFLSTKLFANRVKGVTDVMAQMKQGKLTGFAESRHPEDEVGFIHTELIHICERLKEYIDKEYVYQLRQKEMELYTLQTQINPHFLYNSLESIRMYLYMEGEAKGSHMVQILSDLFRNIMKKDVVVTFRDEVRYLESYLELHRFRMGDRMSYDIRIPDEIYRYATIKHVLQPAVENALVHGIEKKGSRISVSAELLDGDIFFRIRDDGAGISEERLLEIHEALKQEEVFQNSIGIYNVNSRLRIVYGPEYGLTIESRLGEGTEVTLRMKAMKKKELENYVQSAYRR